MTLKYFFSNNQVPSSLSTTVTGRERRANGVSSKSRKNRIILLAILPCLKDCTKIKISLWLVPPVGQITHIIHKEIELLSKIQGTPTFPPHVTMAGGIEVNHREVVRIIMSLKKEFLGFGPVPCKFDRVQGIVAGYKDDEKKICQWNQSTVAILKREEKLLNSIKIARKIMLDKNDDTNLGTTHLFAAPTYEPHLSLAYSHQHLGSFIVNKNVPPDFEANEVALWRTDPSSLEGVNEWYEIDRFSLC